MKNVEILPKINLQKNGLQKINAKIS